MPNSDRDPFPAERRRYKRVVRAERATILIGPTSLVFGKTLNLSRGGTCLRAPSGFAVRVGEQLRLASAGMGPERAVRVVDISNGGLHCAFDREDGTDPDQIPEG